ncbi:MAG TPA: helix-turn-helix transcriptional regulator [Steroidobacteraceae bacterium]|nr:helix-turn-helix transcriptional regulator [Steroidobacteraceae bacterium]
MAQARQKRTRRGAARKASTSAPHRDFGSRLAGFRAAASLTQRELADRLGVTRRQIAYYESGSGRPPGALLGLLADLFRVSTDVLLGREVSKAPASRLSSAVLARLQQIERMGADVCRRLEATLEQFIVAEGWRRGAGRKARRGPAAKRR